MGQSPDSSSYNADCEGLPFYQGNADFGETHPTPRIWCSEPKKVAEAGDILISVRAPVGAINVADERCCIGRGLAAVRPSGSDISNAFLALILQSKRAYLDSMSTGSTFKAIGKKVLSLCEVPLYSHEVQNRIACQINGIDDCLRSSRKLLSALDGLVKSQFVEMFGNGAFPTFVLGERCRTASGGTPSKHHSEYYDNGTIPWLTSGEVGKGKIKKPSHYITEAGLRNSSAKNVPPNTVVVAMYGATAGQIGIVEYETATNQAVCCIPPSKGLLPTYLRFALENERRWLVGQCSGGAQPNISQGIVRQVRIPDAPVARQRTFADFVAQVDKLGFSRLIPINNQFLR